MTVRALAATVALGIVLAGAGRAEEAAAPGEAAPRKVRIGLDRLRAEGVAPALAQAVEERVCAVLTEVAAGADVVCPSDVAAAALLARHALVFGECRSDECLKRVEAVSRADRRVSGALERGEKGLVLSLQITGPEGRVVERLPEDLDAIAERLPGAVKKLLR